MIWKVAVQTHLNIIPYIFLTLACSYLGKCTSQSVKGSIITIYQKCTKQNNRLGGYRRILQTL